MRRFASSAAAFSLLAIVVGLGGLSASSACAADAEKGIGNPVHQYWSRPPNDRFSQLKNAIEGGKVTLSTDNERAFLRDLLARLEVPESSQMLVSSTTSLQKRLINPRNPRAIYFNEDTYVGYVPRGSVEVASVDPELGTIFYIFDPVRPGRIPQATRADGCMNCHSTPHLDFIPGLVVESVVPGMTGGGEKAFRRERSGHAIPLADRFGGWTVTGAPESWRHWGNIVMVYDGSGRHERHVRPGELFDLGRYPVATSDILPHLLHEHQVGFVNRALHAAYAFREWSATAEPGAGAVWRAERECIIEGLAASLVEYVLFADEVALPSGGMSGDPAFKEAFLARRSATADGHSLKDFDLQTHLFRNRCSYMIYSATFAGLPKELKDRVFYQLHRALADDRVPAQFDYLPRDERRRIRAILNETVAGFTGVGRKMNLAQENGAPTQ